MALYFDGTESEYVSPPSRLHGTAIGRREADL